MNVRPTSVYTLPEVAEGLGISVRTLQRAVKVGNLNATRAGLHTFVSGRCLLAWVERGTAGARGQESIEKATVQN